MDNNAKNNKLTKDIMQFYERDLNDLKASNNNKNRNNNFSFNLSELNEVNLNKKKFKKNEKIIFYINIF